MHPPGQVQGLGGSPHPLKPGSSTASSIYFCRNKRTEAVETLFRKEQDSAFPSTGDIQGGGERALWIQLVPARTRSLAAPSTTHLRPARLSFPSSQSHGLSPVAQIGEGEGFLGPLSQSLWARNPPEAQSGAQQGVPASWGLGDHSVRWD